MYCRSHESNIVHSRWRSETVPVHVLLTWIELNHMLCSLAHLQTLEARRAETQTTLWTNICHWIATISRHSSSCFRQKKLFIYLICLHICDFLLVINSNLGPILPRFRDRLIAGFLHKIALHLYSTQILGVPWGSLRLDCRCWGSRTEDRKLLSNSN